MTNQIIDIARECINKGLSPIPIPYQSKRPIHPDWPKLRINGDNVAEYFKDDELNIGVLLGNPSNGVIDIDLDCHEAIVIAPIYFPVSESFGRKSTPRSHFLYRCPNIKTKKFQADGMIMEIRSTGCQTIFPGSTHPSGERIEVYSNGGIQPISEKELLLAASRTAAASLIARHWNNVSRHDATLALTGALLHSGWCKEDIGQFILAIITAANDEEADDRKRAVINTIEKFQAGAKITGWPTLAEYFDGDVIKKVETWLDINHGFIPIVTTVEVNNDWAEPLPLSREMSVPSSYPVEALGEIAADVVNKMTQIIQTPTAISGQSILMAMAQAVQAHADLEIDGRIMPISLFGITIALSGERKSEADRTVTAPQRQFQHDKLKDYREEMTDYETDSSIYIKARDKILRSKANSTLKKETLHELGAAPVPPVAPILFTEEPTAEGLVMALGEDWPSMGLFSDEGGKFLGGYSMQDSNRTKTIAQLCKLWDGTDISITRAGNKKDGQTKEFTTNYYGQRLSMHLMIQPVLSDGIFNDDLLTKQGFTNRCLPCFPQSTIGTRVYNETSLCDTPAVRRYASRITDILHYPLPIAADTRNELVPRVICLSHEAKIEWVNFHNHIENMLAVGGELYVVRSPAGKIPEQAARIATVLALFDDIEATEVSVDHLLSGIKLAEYYLSEVIRLYESAFNNPELEKAQTLLTWLEKQDESIHDLRHIYQYGPNTVRTKNQALHALEILLEHHWVRQLEGNKWEVQHVS